MPRTVAALALLAGCGYNEDSFNEDYIDAVCAKYDECGWLETFGWADAAACVDALQGAASSGDTAGDTCEYDGAAAKDCVSEWEGMSCDDLNAGTTPSTCADVCL
jgi:hypothetical protein